MYADFAISPRYASASLIIIRLLLVNVLTDVFRTRAASNVGI
jgi:hypothetical protein